MSKFIKGIEETSLSLINRKKREVRKIIRDLAKDIINGTPVDEGVLINNWYASNRNPPKQTTKQNDPSGKKSLQRVDKALTRLKIGQTFYLANNLPYARVVEYGMYPNPPKNPTGKTINGFSKQAPAGMVRTNVNKAKAKLASRGRK